MNIHPKRRKSIDNPYELIHSNHQYIVEFMDSKKRKQRIQINKKLYNAFNDFELEDIKWLHEFERHREYSLLCDETLYQRSKEKEDSLEEQATDYIPMKAFYPNEKEWQYFSETFSAPWDFKSLKIEFLESMNANDFYVTNLNLMKDVRSVTYEYDEFGNVKTSKNLNDEFSKFQYDTNNELINRMNPKGKHFLFEYDNTVSNRVLRGISELGISNEIIYDVNGNPIATKIINRKNRNTSKEGFYKIRLKGTNKALRLINQGFSVKIDECGHDK